MALCPDCDGEGRTLVTFGAVRTTFVHRPLMLETAALRECAVCDGIGWYDPTGH